MHFRNEIFARKIPVTAVAKSLNVRLKNNHKLDGFHVLKIILNYETQLARLKII